MAILPRALLDSLQGVAGFDEAAFRDVHQSNTQVTSIRINPAKWPNENSASLSEKFSILHSPVTLSLSKGSISSVPWSRYGFYLSERPSFTFDPLFHAGCYYVQEASSFFLEQALQQTTDLAQPLKVLDLCATPGGKSTHLQSLLSSDSLLVSNEVIRSRAAILKQNIIKWGSENVIVTNNDPKDFAALEGFFDVLMVDAPCSGSGLFRRDADAINQWSLENVQLCCGRQKRILADAVPALKEGGILIYSTCSYSKEEDEDLADWMIKELGMENIKLQIEKEWRIVESFSEKRGASGYRFFPYNTQGEGFYLSVFRKTSTTNEPHLKEATLERATAAEKTVVQKWLQTDATRELFRTPHVHGLLKKFVRDYAILKNYLKVQYAGVAIGEVLRDKLLPEHALALSLIASPSIPAVSVDYETAIRYLQRADIHLQTTPGWQLVQYHEHNIGWINALPNRINNYYPKEGRILKQHSGDGFEK